MKTLKIIFAVAAALTTPAFAGSPSITFTSVPPIGSYANVVGKVTGVSPYSTYGVALFLDIYGAYYTKPTLAQPITPIESDGTFLANITTGGTGSLDAFAEQVIGYVVPLSYSPVSTVSGASAIPQDLINASVANVVANKFTPINFANYWWEVKNTGNGTRGPSANYFTNSNVNIDSKGRLHLAIRYSAGKWRCAEVILTNSFGYGTYRIWLDNDLSTLPTNVVFGFFTWNNSTLQYNYQEIDVEFSNGSVVGKPTNWQYVIQPYYIAGNRTNFSEPTNGMSNSTQTITWTPDAVYFESYTNHVADQKTFNILSSADMASWAKVAQTNVVTNSTNTITITGLEQKSQFYQAKMDSFAGTPTPFKSAWLTNDVPPAGGEQLHLNLWLNGGGALSSKTTDSNEVIISKIEFIPLTNIEPKLQVSQVATNQTKLLLKYRSN